MSQAGGSALVSHLRRRVTAVLNRVRASVLLRLEPLAPRADIDFLGTQYGGWPVVVHPSAQGGLCYSAGIGEDASFDRDLIKRTGCTVHAFDPVPRAAEYVAHEFADEPKFVFHQTGLWSTDTELPFFGPELDGWVSHSAVDFRHTPEMFKAVVRSVPSMMRELGHDHLNILKLSVEGAQFAVLEPVLSAGIPIDQILVEFTPPVALRKVRDQCARLRAAGYDLAAAPLQVWNWKCAFVRRDLPVSAPR